MSLTNNWFCYLLHCADNTLYCGITNNLDKRIASHNAGKAAKYTRSRYPVVLVFAEPCDDRSAASRRELAIKKLPRSEKLRLIESDHSQQAGIEKIKNIGIILQIS
jgi:putative endonuclease